MRTGNTTKGLSNHVSRYQVLQILIALMWLQAASGMGVFGPRTVYCIALKDAPGTHEFLLQDDGKWMHVKETTEIGKTCLI